MDILNPTACEEKEPFALQALGESMMPEFDDGTVITIDPSYPPLHGAYVLARYQDEYHFRQLIQQNGKSYLAPLNPAFPTLELEGEFEIAGVITQQYHKRIMVHYEYPEGGVIKRRERNRKTKEEKTTTYRFSEPV